VVGGYRGGHGGIGGNDGGRRRGGAARQQWHRLGHRRRAGDWRGWRGQSHRGKKMHGRWITGKKPSA
jgi:hypothetical protein